MQKPDLNFIRTYKPRLIGENFVTRSAVCIPLVERADGYDLLFEVRSSKLEAQPGDICFPGGGIEEGESPKEAALRELCEELLVSRDNIGETDTFHTENIIVHTFAGMLTDYNGTFNQEVERVFNVPLSFFLENEPEKHKISYELNLGEDFPYERISGGKNYKWRGRSSVQLFYQYGEYCIWGLTAKLVTAFADLFR